MLGLCCCSHFSLVVAGGGLFSTQPAVGRLFIATASFLAGLRLQGQWASVVVECVLSSWLLGLRAQAQQFWHTGLVEEPFGFFMCLCS